MTCPTCGKIGWYCTCDLDIPAEDPILEAAKNVADMEDDLLMDEFEDDSEWGTPTGQSVGTTEVKASRWSRFKHALGDWWERARVRLCCWILRIDEFRIKMKVDTLLSWRTNIPRNHLILDGTMDLMDGGVFEHMRGTLTLTSGATATVAPSIEVTSGTIHATCPQCGELLEATNQMEFAHIQDHLELCPKHPLAGMDKSMLERYGYEAVDDDPKKQSIRRARARGPADEQVAGTPPSPDSTLRANSAGSINTPPPVTLKGMLKSANGRLLMGDPKLARYYVEMALRHMGDAWDIGDEVGETVGAWPSDMTRAEAQKFVDDNPYKNTLEVFGILNPAFGRMIITNRRVITMADTEMILKPIEEPDQEGEAYCCAHCPMSSPENDPCQWKPPAEDPKDNSLPPCCDCHDDESECGKERLTCKVEESNTPDGEPPDGPCRHPEEARMTVDEDDQHNAPGEYCSACGGLIEAAEDPDEDDEGPCAHPDNPSGECNLECNYFDEETDRLDDGECKWHHEPKKSYPEGSCYHNQHPEVNAYDDEVHECAGEVCPNWEGGRCPYLKPANEGM